MDCFGLFTFDRRKKLRENVSTNVLLSEQNPKKNERLKDVRGKSCLQHPSIGSLRFENFFENSGIRAH
jgi:hypothetical protein